MSEQSVKVDTERPVRKKRQSMFIMTLRRLAKNKLAVLGLVVLVLMIAIAFLSLIISPYPFEQTDLYNTFGTPSKDHLFGTDELGRDILSRLMVGTKYSLRIGLLSVLYSSVIGIALGCISGYYGGKVDGILMRVMDVFSAIPALVLAIAICAVLGPGINNCIISIAVSGAPSSVAINSSHLEEVIKLYVDKIIEYTRSVLSELPAEVSSAVVHGGIYLTGGLTRLDGFAEYFAEHLGVSVNQSDEPIFAPVLGGSCAFGRGICPDGQAVEVIFF